MPKYENRPAGNGADSRTTGCTQYIDGLGRRREATYRLPPYGCCRDPWICTCREGELTTESALAAAEHLDQHGLAPLFRVNAARALWRAGHRDLATLCIQQVTG